PPDADAATLAALSELNFRAARKRDRFDPAGAGGWYRDAAAYAAFALAADPDGPTADAATDLHNRAVEPLVRLVQARRATPAGTPADWRQAPATLALFDPFEVRAVSVGGRAVRLATDRTTPLAEQETESNLEVFRRIGVLRPDAIRPEVGLYMPQPYRPGKI